MKLVIQNFMYENPGIAIIPETEYEAAVLSRFWKAGKLTISTGRASSEAKSANGLCYGIKFREYSDGSEK